METLMLGGGLLLLAVSVLSALLLWAACRVGSRDAGDE